MQNALLIGLSRQMTLKRQLDVIANNVANVNTTGYKSDQSLFEEYLNSGAHEDNFKGPGRLVSFVLDRGTYRDFSQGPLTKTSDPLDVAIDGKGFLTVQTEGGDRYTRDGNLQLNNQGQLVTDNGDLVLGTGGPITFQPTDHDINIAPDGTITVLEGTATTDTIRGKLQVVSFANPQALQKQGSNLYAATNPDDAQPDLTSTVRQGYLEKSNVSAVSEMSQLIQVSRAYEQVANMLQSESSLHQTAINQLAAVPT